MKLLSLLDRLAQAPALVANGRRPALALLGRSGWRLAAAALPLAAALPATAAPSTLLDSLTLLLQLARTQGALYTQGLAAAGLIPAAQVADFQLLVAQQQQQADYFASALTNGGAALPPLPSFDFSGRRNVASNPVLFADVLTSYPSFLQLAQLLEDLGARTYLGQLGTAAGQPLLSRDLVRLQATEARHAAHLRTLRRAQGATVRSWPSTADAAIVLPAGAAPLLRAASNGEDTREQLLARDSRVPFATLLTTELNTAVAYPAVAEAFDEPVETATAQAALALFSY